ncbi:MltA domain-containing protein [Thalassotalea psychrophila]|uniref:MltA domain-containing protein n=1 Tax=Thalassotalea psychrophila TaxID=3065647 RepID=A0ABY9TT06_9GAMM|nr:MltA domain-containing protein [Colwelliaceae bacterium SQ149]
MKLIISIFLASISVNAIADNARFVLEPNPSIGSMQLFKTSDLCTVATNTNTYINNHKAGDETDPLAVHPGKVFSAQISLDRVQNTLSFICETYITDVRTKQKSRLQNTEFLKHNFDFYRWYPDTTTALNISQKSTNAAKNRLLTNIPEEQLFITKYYTKLLNASPVKTAEFNQALYALPFDEQGLTPEQAELKKDSLTRFKFTRQEVIQGKVAENNLAKPLVWISEDGLHDVLLQGTGVLEVNGETRYFNVHRNNGINYDYSIGKTEQARYWYFAEVPSVMGYGKTLESKIAVKPQVTFAGNMADLGLGKLIMVNYPLNGNSVSQMGILADTGGAFDNNRFQLDFLVDSYYGWSDYHLANKHLPDYANTWIMLLKQ